MHPPGCLSCCHLLCLLVSLCVSLCLCISAAISSLYLSLFCFDDAFIMWLSVSLCLSVPLVSPLDERLYLPPPLCLCLGREYSNACFSRIYHLIRSRTSTSRISLVDVCCDCSGIGASISSDVSNLLFLLKLFGGLSPSLFLDRLCQDMRRELLAECNYLNEMQFQSLFKFLVERDFQGTITVPSVYKHLTTKHILTTEFVHAVGPAAGFLSRMLLVSIARCLLLLLLLLLLQLRMLLMHI